MFFKKKDLSVCVCTHNPRADYLMRTLKGLSCQTLPVERWELILVDNNSSVQIILPELAIDCVVVRETTPGLTAARICGLRHSTADLLVYVDDDNILDDDFLENALALSCEYPMLGTFSSSIRPEYEQEPEPWMKPYLRYLAVGEFDKDTWCNAIPSHCFPRGAGMVVKRTVMTNYADELRGDKRRSAMDRNGKSLLAGGDTDIGYSCVRMGLGCGRFQRLKLTHLIPKGRLEPHYLYNIVTYVTLSHEYLAMIHGLHKPQGIRAILAMMKYRILALIGSIVGKESPFKILGAINHGKYLSRKLWSSQLYHNHH